MHEPALLHELISCTAKTNPEKPALSFQDKILSYAQLHEATCIFSAALMHLGMPRAARIGIYLDKRFETVMASFGTAAAGCVFVPINPLLKPEQVAYILRDCNVRVLVTSPERHALLNTVLTNCPDLQHVIVSGQIDTPYLSKTYAIHTWSDVMQTPVKDRHRIIDTDMLAILYTSGSTGKPKGVVLSHRNMVCGAKSVASYLQNNADDALLAALPLSFDAGFSQLTTGFASGARVVLLNYLMPRDVIKALDKEKITGLTGVPSLWIALAQVQTWPEGIVQNLRYIANTGGKMPLATLNALRKKLPYTKPYLMYGLTEAFRATYLNPTEIDRRPDSIGKAIPNSEVMVLREDGTPCAPNEEGELVQRGALVALGYWNDAEKTAERFKPLPTPLRQSGLMLPEVAVFSGDTVKCDNEGFLYFVGRRDEMIKVSGYRISPTEVEEAAYGTKMVRECAALGVPHPTLGQAIVLVVCAQDDTFSPEKLLLCLRQLCPAYQVPAKIAQRTTALPRNPNGKIDRKLLSDEFLTLFNESLI